jgi:5-methylcytosine-specific restriction endonuclease McrA
VKLQTLKPRLASVPAKLGRTIQPGSWRSPDTGSSARGYTYRWQLARKAFLAEHPLCECEDCLAGEKRLTVATVVDHHIPHRGDERLFWDRSNWRAMAKPCHDRKTQRETAAVNKNSSCL